MVKRADSKSVRRGNSCVGSNPTVRAICGVGREAYDARLESERGADKPLRRFESYTPRHYVGSSSMVERQVVALWTKVRFLSIHRRYDDSLYAATLF